MNTRLLLLSLFLSSTALAAPGKPYIGAHGGALFTDDIGADLGARIGYGFNIAKTVQFGPELGVRVLPNKVFVPWAGVKAGISVGPIGLTPFVRAGLSDGEMPIEIGSFGSLPIPFISLYGSATLLNGTTTGALGAAFSINIPPGG
jgi:hypothetical protein